MDQFVTAILEQKEVRSTGPLTELAIAATVNTPSWSG